ncbi:MAG TPA: tyrosine--tRNA ligase [Candidatus Hydrogenedentes bacterium]|nr:MAG: Tyrosine--tRNA ligase [Candidatus Hydrogenedentes bacterium ADurb.Bin170]HNZ49002.1 tyrosine--tRNA ligase [Candidatus Hydrogenedentota bacterium]HOD96162.1 tyrosine--tRNA ligase [Candidatus Hydrogenedentota bacterium]HOM49370.1 tyrosine--tRNA ligase [Candidatus Hydrogenedentota bacterium]HOR51623.1 tyrosine--tRNA ligase [Candidatus Hydrogenedentota bacterium]
MSFFNELHWRGFVNQMTHPELPDILDKESVTLYCGFDPTAYSLHIGSLLPIMGLAHFQRAGHTPIALVGGGTGLIGDPSGKAQERTMLSREEVEHNCEGIRAQLERFLDFKGSHAAIMVNNADWLCEVKLLDFMRDIGKFFSVNALLNRDSVRARLEDRESGISFTEFSYILLQAYDYLYLNKKYNCRLQIGGADQWGNIVSGMDITRRLNNASTFGLTFPLVTKSDGAKFGKSEKGNIWLDSTRTSPYQFYQFWINQADADVSRFLRYFTFLPETEILALDEQIREAPQERAAQKRLAEEVTRLVHGETALANAVTASNAMFGGDWTALDAQTLLDVFSEVPHTEMPLETLQRTELLNDLLVHAEVFASKGEARRLIRNGGLYVNNMRIEKEDVTCNALPLLAGNLMVARIGKKSYHLIRFV